MQPLYNMNLTPIKQGIGAGYRLTRDSCAWIELKLSIIYESVAQFSYSLIC